MKKLIIFDLDGVLYDSSDIVRSLLFDTYPTLTPEKMQEILSGNFHEELAKFKANNPVKQETEEEKKARHTAYTEMKASTPMFPGMAELVERLHGQGYIISINTSAFERNCIPLLERAGIKRFVDFVASAEVSKDKTEKFKIILDKYATTPEDSIFITDTLGDVREAEAANIPTIAVTWGAQKREIFTREQHKNLIVIVDTVEELEKELMK